MNTWLRYKLWIVNFRMSLLGDFPTRWSPLLRLLAVGRRSIARPQEVSIDSNKLRQRFQARCSHRRNDRGIPPEYCGRCSREGRPPSACEEFSEGSPLVARRCVEAPWGRGWAAYYACSCARLKYSTQIKAKKQRVRSAFSKKDHYVADMKLHRMSIKGQGWRAIRWRNSPDSRRKPETSPKGSSRTCGRAGSVALPFSR